MTTAQQHPMKMVPVTPHPSVALEVVLPADPVLVDLESVALVRSNLCQILMNPCKAFIYITFTKLVSFTCGQTTNQNSSYFSNLNYPSSYDATGSCQLTVNKASSNVCQLR